jgi:tetratricopeptide (TPR) repeat protein
VVNLEEILQSNDSCSNLSYYIGYLKLLIGQQKEAINHFQTAIDKCDDNLSYHYTWKGIAMAMCDDHENALNEFRVGLSIDKTDYSAALYKGRCYLYLKDLERAFYAFKDFMDGGEREREIKFWIGNFFFANGLNKHAEESYAESITLGKNETCMKELIKSYIVQKNLVKALELLDQIQENYPNKKYSFDLNLLVALKHTSKGEWQEGVELMKTLKNLEDSGYFFDFSDLHFYLGVAHFYIEDYQRAIVFFEKGIELKYKNGISEDLEKKSLEQIFLQAMGEEEEETIE